MSGASPVQSGVAGSRGHPGARNRCPPAGTAR